MITKIKNEYYRHIKYIIFSKNIVYCGYRYVYILFFLMFSVFLLSGLFLFLALLSNNINVDETGISSYNSLTPLLSRFSYIAEAGGVPAGNASGYYRTGMKLLFPLKINDSVSATFGEYRSTHFHAGVDFRTKRRNGIPVIAPSSGKVINLYGDENSYGLMLTFKADNGLIYKFAHLSAFENNKFGLGDYVKKYRAANNRRFNFDIDLNSQNISAAAGDIIAYSGDTGAGPPHLHFEIVSSARGVPDSNNAPGKTDFNGYDKQSSFNLTGERIVNPFRYLNVSELKDTAAVNISSLVVVPDGSNSLIEGRPAAGYFKFNSESSINLSLNAVGPIKLLVKVFDENKSFANNESKMGVYYIQLNEVSFNKDLHSGASSKLIYSLKFDSIETGYSRMPEIVYDMYYSKISGGNFYYNMFYAGNFTSRPYFINTGGEKNGVILIKEGEKRYFEIVAADYFNNVSKKMIEIKGNKSLKTENIIMHAGKKKKSKNKNLNKDLIVVEYLENVILFKIKIIPGTMPPVIKHSGEIMKKYMDGEYICYYKGYEEFLNMPEITVHFIDEMFAVDSREKIEKKSIVNEKIKKYKIKIYKIKPGEMVELNSGGERMFKLTSLTDAVKPFYFGELNPAPAGMEPETKLKVKKSSISNVSEVLNYGFSRPGFEGKIYCAYGEDDKKINAAGIYVLYLKNKVFMGASKEIIGGKKYISAFLKNTNRLNCGVFYDENIPLLKS